MWLPPAVVALICLVGDGGGGGGGGGGCDAAAAADTPSCLQSTARFGWLAHRSYSALTFAGAHSLEM